MNTVTLMRNFFLLCIILGFLRILIFHGYLVRKKNSQVHSSNDSFPYQGICSSNKKAVEKPGISGLPIFMPFSRSRLGKRGYLKKEDLFIHRANFLRYHALGAFNSRFFASNAAEIWSQHVWDRCALVGNSGSLLSSNQGEEINGYDIVVRFNQAPTRGYEQWVGNKTTFRVLNALWSNFYSKNVKLRKDGSLDSRGNIHIGEIKNVPLELNATLIISRTSLENFNKVCSALEKTREDVHLLLLAPKIVTAVKWLLNEYRRILCTHGYGPYVGGHTPSSGFVAIFILIQLCKDTALYGFGDSEPPSQYHYYAGGGHRTVGNSVHSWSLEMEMIEALLKNKHLRLH
jgi:hypothetical protein